MTEPTQAVHLRDAVAADSDALAELHARSRAVYYRAGGHEVASHPDEKYREAWRKMVDDPGIAVLVAASAENIVGVITVDVGGVFPTRAPHEKHVRLSGIFVEPGQWSIGVGSTLMARFVSIARQADAVGEVEVWQRNSRAIRFYERHGWTRDGTSRPGPAGAPYLGYVHLP
jgi:ribosomal protein S18 acetylase RimI-like enzyme